MIKLNHIFPIKSPANRKVVASPFKEVKRVGIIYPYTNEVDLNLIKKYTNYLKEYKKEVMTFGYIPGKQIPPQFIPKLSFDYFCDQSISITNKPKPAALANFSEYQYDVLIDASVVTCFPVKAIVVQSNAKLKIGAAHLDYSDQLDFQININKEKKLRYLLQQIDHYLHLLKNE